jgi:arylsulfatase A-like enzyme
MKREKMEKTIIRRNIQYGIFACMMLQACDDFRTEPAQKPNVIIIITDDQGYGDISAHGNPVIETPNLDKLCGESVRLTNYHVDPTCSPSRAALLTGRYSHRVDVWHTIMGGNFLPDEEVTMAEFFREAGYNTVLFGKWHLGGSYPFRPVDQGFDTWIGQGDGGTGTTSDYWFNDRVNDMYLTNGKWSHIKGYGPDVFFSKAGEYIKNYKSANPFFLYLSTYVPHNPLTIPDTSWTDKYKGEISPKSAYYYASIEQIDNNIGLLRKTIADKGIDDNTILIFMTDNGGTYGIEIFNAGMRGGKGTQYDGGHRVPCFIHWPGGNLNKGKDIKTLTAHIDIFPTLIDLCGLPQNKKLNFDGTSLKHLIYNEGKAFPERSLIVEVQRQIIPEKWKKSAVMTDQWRLIDGKELYNIVDDPGQSHDLSSKHTDVVKELRTHYETYWQSVKTEKNYSKAPIIGTANEETVFLNAADWMPPEGQLTPWNQHHISSGMKQRGYWDVRVKKSGKYKFEVSRWPPEAGLAMAKTMIPKQDIDAYETGTGREFSIYNTKNRHYTALPVKKVRLQVDNNSREQDIDNEDITATFYLNLDTGTCRVTAELLHNDGTLITGGYYVTIEKEEK